MPNSVGGETNNVVYRYVSKNLDFNSLNCDTKQEKEPRSSRQAKSQRSRIQRLSQKIELVKA